jgi:hypothetical protein
MLYKVATGVEEMFDTDVEGNEEVYDEDAEDMAEGAGGAMVEEPDAEVAEGAGGALGGEPEAADQAAQVGSGGQKVLPTSSLGQDTELIAGQDVSSAAHDEDAPALGATSPTMADLQHEEAKPSEHDAEGAEGDQAAGSSRPKRRAAIKWAPQPEEAHPAKAGVSLSAALLSCLSSNYMANNCASVWDWIFSCNLACNVTLSLITIPASSMYGTKTNTWANDGTLRDRRDSKEDGFCKWRCRLPLVLLALYIHCIAAAQHPLHSNLSMLKMLPMYLWSSMPHPPLH